MKKGYNLIQVVIIIIITSVISALTVGVIIYNGTNSAGKMLFDENIAEFLDAYNEIDAEFYEDVDKKKLIKGAIDGMMNYLGENYSTYMNKEEASDLIGSLNQKYNGVGIVILGNLVTNVVDGSPAEKAGILVGDKIIKVNDVEVKDEDNTKITDIIKNVDNVVIVVNRDGVEKTFNVETNELIVPQVSHKVLEDNNIGYVQIGLFSANVTNEMKSALKKLNDKNITSLILDLRGNSGGYLDQAYNTASLFLKKGEVVYSLKSKDKIEQVFKDNDNNSTSYKIVVLINNSTASAAEILATSLKDSYGAIIVGTKSFGKGKVQHTYNLSDGDLIKYTTSKWLRPNGECVDTVGIIPDYNVEIEYIFEKDENGDDIPIDYIDTQLNKAIELLKV